MKIYEIALTTFRVLTFILIILSLGLTLPLVTTEEGDKFGKSAGNAIWLDPQKTTPYSLYQFFIRTKDSDVEKLLKLFTFYTLGEIKDIMFKHKEHPEERYPQTCLADQLTTLVHGGKDFFRLAWIENSFEICNSNNNSLLQKRVCNKLFVRHKRFIAKTSNH